VRPIKVVSSLAFRGWRPPVLLTRQKRGSPETLSFSPAFSRLRILLSSSEPTGRRPLRAAGLQQRNPHTSAPSAPRPPRNSAAAAQSRPGGGGGAEWPISIGCSLETGGLHCCCVQIGGLEFALSPTKIDSLKWERTTAAHLGRPAIGGGHKMGQSCPSGASRQRKQINWF